MANGNTGKLTKVTWKQVRTQVKQVNPTLAKIIDELSPSDDYWLAKVSYPYGSLVLKRALLMIPNDAGQIVPITDPSLNREIQEGLIYNLKSNPVSLVLNNSFEIFLPLADRTIPLSGLIHAGVAFGAWRVLNPKSAEQPAFIWDMTAGARSTFMLPKITEAKKHMEIKKKYDLTADVPNSLMDHWEIFRQLAHHPKFQEPWNAEILYFPRQWFEHLNDVEWKPFYYYFHDAAWGGSELWRNQLIWNLIFSLIVKDYPSRPSAYIMDTVKYLLYMGGGALAGFSPVKNTLTGPFAELQRIYKEEYELRNYPPVIMHPCLFDVHNDQANSVYYSLQFSCAPEFKPSSRTRTSIVRDLHEIRSLMMRCERELLSDKFNLEGSSLSWIFNTVKFDYFHNNVELHTGMRNSAEMPKEDKNLITTLDGKVHKEFPDTCSFVKGCIRISRISND